MNEPFDWETLRADVADVQRPLVADDELLRKGRARLLLATRSVSRPAPSGRWRRARVAFAAAAVVALSVLRFSHHAEPPLSFNAGNSAAAGQLGAWLSPGAAGPLPLRFSDGTVVSVAREARARVVRTTAHGADLVLEQGSLSLAVVHHEGGEWHVGAGPFTVLVTGTKFDVAWNAVQRTFTLSLHEGSVQVSGPTLGGAGRRVKPGEVLRVAIDERPVPAVAASDSTRSDPATPPSAEAAKPPPQVSRATALGSWKGLANGQRYADALAAAEADGFDATCRAASASDLVLLGNAARFAGSAPRAEQAFRLVRSRFAGTRDASMAAFYLGRIAYDQRGNRREAAQWFQSYLSEEPSGGLAREAAGRLLEAERALGDVEAARASARSYLQKYPSGPHASLARDVLKP